MIRQLRDYDFNVRMIATEGFCKLLMCEKINEPQDILSRLILIKFDAAREGSHLDQIIEANKNSEEHVKLCRERQHSLNQVRKCLDDFFNYYVRLSLSRCREICLATI